MHERLPIEHERGDGKERRRVRVARESERDQGDQEACERSAASAEGEPETERDRRSNSDQMLSVATNTFHSMTGVNSRRAAGR